MYRSIGSVSLKDHRVGEFQEITLHFHDQVQHLLVQACEQDSQSALLLKTAEKAFELMKDAFRNVDSLLEMEDEVGGIR